MFLEPSREEEEPAEGERIAKHMKEWILLKKEVKKGVEI